MMADMEKTIKEKLDEIVGLTRGLNYVSFMTAVENANEILALVKAQEKENSKINNSYLKLLHVASKQPRIVRCKDCKYGREPILSFRKYCVWCERIQRHNSNDWFCADGDAKEGR